MIILILEDDERQAVALKNIITDYKKNWIIYTTQTYEEALYTCAKFPIDIFLLDIELGKKSDKNGFDFAKEIRMMNKYTNIPIIFITGYKEQVFQAINSIHCYNYIVKPYAIEDVRNAIDDCFKSAQNELYYINIRDKNNIYYKIYFNDIIYIKSDAHNSIFYTINGLFTFFRCNLSNISDKLDNRFVRIHKTCIINLDYIKLYDKTTLTITTDYGSLSVGRQYKTNIENLL